MSKIPCELINGMNKSAAYEVGKAVDRQAMGAQWNAVYVAGGWRLVDAFWASTCVVGKKSGEWALMDADRAAEDEDEEAAEGKAEHRINEFYFLTDPQELIWTHFPDKPEWQLLKTILPFNDYQDHFYVRERFHLLGMAETPQTQRSCVLGTSEGEVSVEFALPPTQSAHYRFKHMLYRSRTKSEEPLDSKLLDRFVFFEHLEDILRFTLRFPVRGTFKLDIYGLDMRESDIFDLCCSYIVECPQSKPHCMPLPDCPALGWGPGQKAKEAGLKPVTHKGAKVLAERGLAEVKLEKVKSMTLHQQLKHSTLDDATLMKYCLTRVEDDHIIIYLRLPQNDEYALKLFVQEEGATGEADNVLNYLLQCQDHTEDGCQPFPNTSHGILGRGPDAARFGVKPLSQQGGALEADGKLSVRFEAQAGVELLCEVHTVDNMAANHVTVRRRKEADRVWVFDLELPVKGEYSLSVFVKEKVTDVEIFSVHAFLIVSSGLQHHDSQKLVGKSDNSIRNETVETSDKEVLIPVPPWCTNALAEFHRRNGQFSSSSSSGEGAYRRQLALMDIGDLRAFQLTLEDYGEYILNVFTQPHPESGSVRNLAKYQVNRRRPGELYSDNMQTLMDTLHEEDKAANDEDPTTVKNELPQDEYISTSLETLAAAENKKQQEQILKAVQQAMDLKDPRQLEGVIARCVEAQVPDDDPLLTRARKLLDALHVKAELMEASQKRDVTSLERALQRAKETNFENQLDLQIALATRLKEHLIRLEKLRHAVLNMEQKTVSEIKSYSNPPVGVHESMMATFLLLGSSLKDVKQWRTCLNLMAKTGRESMMRKISQFDPRAVPLRAAVQAKKVTQAFTTDQIRGASAGAATFYIWAQGMIDEVESYGGSEKADQLRLQK